MSKILFVFSPEPASHLSTVASHSGCAIIILESSTYIRKHATAIQRSILFSLAVEVPYVVQRGTQDGMEKREEKGQGGGGDGKTVCR